MHARVTALAGGLALALAPQTVDACSCLFENDQFHVRPGGLVPSDFGGLVWEVSNSGIYELQGNTWRPKSLDPTRKRLVTQLELWRVTDEGPRLEAYELDSLDTGLWLVIPEHGFETGDRFRARSWRAGLTAKPPPPEYAGSFEVVTTINGPYSHDFSQVDFEVGPRTKRAAGKWTLSAGEHRLRPLRVQQGVTCSAEIIAETLALELEPPPDMPTSEVEAYHFETYVDGRRWRAQDSDCQMFPEGRNWTGRIGSDLVYAACDELTQRNDRVNGSAFIHGLGYGKHEVEIRAHLPAGPRKGRTYRSNPIAFEFACEPTPGMPLEPQAKPEPDPEPDPKPESEPPEPESRPDPPTAEPPPISTESRGGCSITPASSIASLLVLLLLPVVGWRRRSC